MSRWYVLLSYGHPAYLRKRIRVSKFSSGNHYFDDFGDKKKQIKQAEYLNQALRMCWLVWIFADIVEGVIF